MSVNRILRRGGLACCIALAAVLLLALGAQAADWTKIATNGITEPNNQAATPGTVFNNKLMVGSDPAGLCVLYSYDGKEFTKIGENRLGDAHNVALFPTSVYNNELYIGTFNPANGAQVWKWDGVGNPTKVLDNGFGAAANDKAYPLGVTDGKLVVGVANAATGIRIYTYDGTHWTQVVGPTATTPAGFGDPNNVDVMNNVAGLFDGRLIFTVTNGVAGMSVYSYDGTHFDLIGHASGTTWGANQVVGFPSVSPVDGNLYVGTAGGVASELWSYDGTSWSAVGTPGFGDPGNLQFQPLVVGGDLYVATFNAGGCLVYKRDGANFTAIADPGMDNTGNAAVARISYFGGTLLSFTWNANGSEVFSTPVDVLSNKYYFAEGTTRDNAVDGKFEEWVCIQNPGDKDANVTLTYMFVDGTTQPQNVVVTKHSRSTISVNTAVGADKDVSTLVESDIPVLAERPMYFNYRSKWTGGHDVIGVPFPRRDYYFAEGTTRANAIDGDFEEWLTFQNPGITDTDVKVDYILENGSTVQKTYNVKKQSRHTVDVNLEVGADHDVSCVVNANDPIVAERPMYFNYHDKWTGGHDVVGAPAPGTEFFFAEGTTRDNPTDGAFEEWICLQNATNNDTTATITYYTDQAGTQTQDVPVHKKSRVTVDVKLKLGVNVDTSFKITSSGGVPILAERPMYFNYHSVWDGGHDVMGCAAPKKNFYFAEGTTRSDFAMWLALMNPGTTNANVTFHYMLGDGTNQQATVTVAPHKRYTRDVLADVGPNQDVSTWVESDKDIVVERPMYFNYHGWATGGHDTLGFGI